MIRETHDSQSLQTRIVNDTLNGRNDLLVDDFLPGSKFYLGVSFIQITLWVDPLDFKTFHLKVYCEKVRRETKFYIIIRYTTVHDKKEEKDQLWSRLDVNLFPPLYIYILSIKTRWFRFNRYWFKYSLFFVLYPKVV